MFDERKGERGGRGTGPKPLSSIAVRLCRGPFDVFFATGYSSQGDGGSGFHSGHFVHMRGLPFRATKEDVAKVRSGDGDGSEPGVTHVFVWVFSSSLP